MGSSQVAVVDGAGAVSGCDVIKRFVSYDPCSEVPFVKIHRVESH